MEALIYKDKCLNPMHLDEDSINDETNFQIICNGKNNERTKRVDYTFKKTTYDYFNYYYCLRAHSSYWYKFIN